MSSAILTESSAPGLERIQTLSYLISTVPSLIGSIFIIAVLVLLKAYSKGLNRIVFFLSVSDLLFSLPLEFFVPATETSCIITSGIHYYGLINSLYWSSVFAFIFLKITKKSQEILESKFKYFLAISAVIPLPWIIFFIWTNYFDRQIGSFCYHTGTESTFEYKVLFMSVLPPIVALIATVYCYLRGFLQLKKFVKASTTEARSLNFMALFVFPLILVFCWLPYIVAYVLDQVGVSIPDEYKVPIIHLSKLQGFLNAIFYGLSASVRRALKEHFARVCVRRQTKQVEESLLESEERKTTNPADSSHVHLSVDSNTQA